MKFILTTITIIVILLVAYVYYDQSRNPPATDTSLLKKKAISNAKESMDDTKMITKVKTREKKIIIKNNAKNAIEVYKSSHINEIIPGENITLEDIENSDATTEEKQRMRYDMLYFESLHMEAEPTLNDEEILNLIEKDLEEGLI